MLFPQPEPRDQPVTYWAEWIHPLDLDLVLCRWTCADVLEGLVPVGEQLSLQHITGFQFLVHPRTKHHFEIGGE